MTRTIKQVERYGALVQEHTEMDELRKTECLCRLCAKLKAKQPDNCRTAEALFAICVSDSIAMSVTRCPEFEAK